MSVIARPPGSSGGSSRPFLSENVLGSFLQSTSVCLDADLLDEEIERMKAEFGNGTSTISPIPTCPLPTPPPSVKSLSPFSTSSRSQHTSSPTANGPCNSGDEGSDTFSDQISLGVGSGSDLFFEDDEELPKKKASQPPKKVNIGWSSESSSSSGDDSSSSSSDSSDSSSSESDEEDDSRRRQQKQLLLQEQQQLQLQLEQEQLKKVQRGPSQQPQHVPKGQNSHAQSPSRGRKRKVSNSSHEGTGKNQKLASTPTPPTPTSPTSGLAIVASLSAAIPRLPVSAMMGVIEIIDPNASTHDMEEFVVDLSSLDENKLLRLHAFVTEQITQQISQLSAQTVRPKHAGKSLKRPRKQSDNESSTPSSTSFPGAGKRPRSPEQAGKKPKSPEIASEKVASAENPGKKNKVPELATKKVTTKKKFTPAPISPTTSPKPVAPIPAEKEREKEKQRRRAPTSPVESTFKSKNALPERETEPLHLSPRKNISNNTYKDELEKKREAQIAAIKAANTVPAPVSVPREPVVVASPPKPETYVKKQRKSKTNISDGGLPKRGKKSLSQSSSTIKKSAGKLQSPAAPITPVVSTLSTPTAMQWPTALFTSDDDDDFVDVVGL